MPTVTRHAPGAFCWPELYTTDQDGAKAFYTALFGWEFRELPLGPGAVYTIFTLDGRDAAACCGLPPEIQAQDAHPHWMAYVAVASADAATAKVQHSGGTVIKAPFDVMEIGRMAAFRDPCGAAFCVWESKGHIGVGVIAEPGALRWTELMTDDTEKSRAFYESVFGWDHLLWPSPEHPTYHIFARGEAPAGGMLAITPEMGSVRPTWVSYFEVADCEAAFAEALELGGQVSVPVQAIPGVGSFAVLIDPAGAHFGILEPAE